MKCKRKQNIACQNKKSCLSTLKQLFFIKISRKKEILLCVRIHIIIVIAARFVAVRVRRTILVARCVRVPVPAAEFYALVHGTGDPLNGCTFVGRREADGKRFDLRGVYILRLFHPSAACFQYAVKVPTSSRHTE